MTTRITLLAILAAAAMIGAARADERISLTPPLYREQARAAAAVRPASELATTPRPVPAAPASPRLVVEAGAR